MVLPGGAPEVHATWGVAPPLAAPLADAYNAGFALAQAQLALQAAVASALQVVPPWSPVLAGPPPPPVLAAGSPPPPPPPPIVVMQQHARPHVPAAAAAVPPPAPAVPGRNYQRFREVANQVGR